MLHLNVRVIYVGNFILFFSALPSLPSTLSGSAAGRRSYSTWSCSWGSGIRTGWCGERTKETQHQKKWMRKVIRKKKATTRDDDDEMRERGKSKCGKTIFIRPSENIYQDLDIVWNKVVVTVVPWKKYILRYISCWSRHIWMRLASGFFANRDAKIHRVSQLKTSREKGRSASSLSLWLWLSRCESIVPLGPIAHAVFLGIEWQKWGGQEKEVK